MSEYNGYFRIASTKNQWNGDDDQSNALYVMKENSGSLEITGEIEDIAPGESLYAARFIEEKGFLVTFEVVDPLFTVDLSDPNNPEIKGELEMPGFSTYLHPLDANHLIGLGRNANEAGLVDGMQLSVFDVSHMSAPVRISHHVFGDSWSNGSEALYNHKAFQYWSPLSLLAIPVQNWNWTDDAEFFNGAYLFKIDPESSLTPFVITKYGEIDHSVFFTPPEDQYDEWYDYWDDTPAYPLPLCCTQNDWRIFKTCRHFQTTKSLIAGNGKRADTPSPGPPAGPRQGPTADVDCFCTAKTAGSKR